MELDQLGALVTIAVVFSVRSAALFIKTASNRVKAAQNASRRTSNSELTEIRTVHVAEGNEGM
jgi:hypothetical protein